MYGFYGGTACDLGFLREVPSLGDFSADCLQSATRVEAVRELPALRALSIGVFDLKDFDFLADVTTGLERLSLGATRSKRPDLEHLPRFGQIKELSIEGHGKGIENVGLLPRLSRLRLRRLSSPDFEPLAHLADSWDLEVTLGSAKDLSPIGSLSKLKQLELCWIAGLSDVSFMPECVALQDLVLDRLRNVTQLPSLKPLKHLRCIRLLQLKGLASITGVLAAPALEVFVATKSTLSAANLAPLLRMPRLRRASVYLRRPEEVQFDRMATEAGVETVRGHEPVVFK